MTRKDKRRNKEARRRSGAGEKMSERVDWKGLKWFGYLGSTGK